MARLPAFDLLRPASLAEAVTLLRSDPGARLLAGGTDLLPNLRRGIEQPRLLIDLGGVRDFDDIGFDASGLLIGAGVTLARLAADARIASAYPAITQAALAVAAPGHRSAATVGGNLCQDTRCVYYNQSAWWRAANDHCLKRNGEICHVAPQGRQCVAAYCGDLAPALLALGAEVELVAQHGTRRIALAHLYTDDGAAPLAIARDEVLACVTLPVASAELVSGYRKARVRGATDFPLAGVACALALDGACLTQLRVALTGTNARPLVVAGTAELLGRPVDAQALALLGRLVQKQASPARTTVTPSHYRRQVAAVLAQRLVRDLAGTDARL
jgi:4-hydroxybenzoyl-CoA reductase subunit beta